MTAQVQSRRTSGEPQGKRRKKYVAFALAGVVATAGVAGAVVTSSAFFTDVKEIGNNTVSLQGIDIDAYPTSGSAVLTSFDLDQLAPVVSSNTTAWDAAPTRKFDVRNISKSPFKYKVEVVEISFTQKDGTTALPNANSSTALSAASVADVVKVTAARAVKGATPTYVPGDSKTLATLMGSGATDPQLLADSPAEATLTAEDSSVATDEAVVGVRFWIDQSLISGWSAADQNLLQNLKISYKIKLSAIQLNN